VVKITAGKIFEMEKSLMQRITPLKTVGQEVSLEDLVLHWKRSAW
jgi:hypothetical protein